MKYIPNDNEIILKVRLTERKMGNFIFTSYFCVTEYIKQYLNKSSE